MATIDKLDIGAYINYAQRTEFVELVNKQYGLDKASVVTTPAAPDFYPRPNDLDLLMGVSTLNPPWAMFLAPRQFGTQRSNPFGFLQILPNLKKKESEGEEADKGKGNLFDKVEPKNDEERQEKTVINKLFTHIGEINELIGFVVGRVGQFLQG